MGQSPGYLVFGVFDSGHDGSSAEEKVIFQGTVVLMHIAFNYSIAPVAFNYGGVFYRFHSRYRFPTVSRRERRPFLLLTCCLCAVQVNFSDGCFRKCQCCLYIAIDLRAEETTRSQPEPCVRFCLFRPDSEQH